MNEKAKCKNCTEEMIEEMKQILIDWAISKDLCFSFEVMQKHAEVLIKAGYRKMPEGSVVLSKEENENWLKWLEQNIEKARQKTAKEILQSVKLRAWGNNADVNGNIWSYSISIYELNEILKEYGVEE